MKSFFQKVRSLVFAHRILVAVIAVVAVSSIAGTVYLLKGTSTQVRYVFAAAEKRTIISSVTGTGQVSASQQIDVTAGVSGDVVSVGATAGQRIGTGGLIAQVDAGDALYDLETAQLSYDKLVAVDPEDLQDAKDTVEDAYIDARVTLAKSSTNAADTLSGIKDLLGGYLDTSTSYARSEQAREYIERTNNAYYDAQNALTTFSKSQRAFSLETDHATIAAAVVALREVTLKVLEAAKYAQDATVYLRERERTTSGVADAAYTSVTGLVGDASTLVSTLSNTKTTLTSADRTLADLVNGPDSLALRGETASLKQKREAYEKYFIRAPFSGVLASVAVRRGDTVNSGTTVATLITTEKVAELSLNEIDAAKVKVGQSATLTFDAFDDVSITGTVAEVDMVGVVSQGVVNYTVRITFDTDDERIKPGMTVSADIVTEKHADVLAVPVSAVKTERNKSYVEVPVGDEGASATLTKVFVETGASNDEFIEIVSGLAVGDRYLARSIAVTTAAPAKAAAPSLFGGGTGARTTGAGGGAFRRTAQ